MGKIQFRSTGKNRTKVFENDSTDSKKSVLPITVKVDPWTEIQEKKPDKTENEKQQYKNAADVYEYLYSKLRQHRIYRKNIGFKRKTPDK